MQIVPFGQRWSVPTERESAGRRARLAVVARADHVGGDPESSHKYPLPLAQPDARI